MHHYLPAIGFSKLDKDGLKELIEEIELRPDFQESAINVDGSQFAELRYMVADNIGLVLRGSYNENDEFIMEYYYPTYYGSAVSTDANVEIIQQSDKENFQAMCDEIRVGVNLIFQLQNMGEFLRISSKKENGDTRGINFAALSVDGKILLPVYSNEKIREKTKIRHEKKMELYNKAKEGVDGAMEKLAMDDMDLYSKVSRRMMKEDVYSIVSTYFMPYGIENDKYDILGEILDVKTAINHLTMEEMYVMLLQCNDIELELCINKNDLLGEPAIGRRFKGIIWLQGTVDFLQ